MEINLVTLGEKRYPSLLAEINDPPPRLYYMGDIELADRVSVAVVGARKASPYGKWAAYNLAAKLAEYDLVSVSGMAYGIDAECHKGSLDKGGKTIAVLGSGVNVCYPKANKAIMEKIAKTGLLLSEQEPNAPPAGWMFPQRNRIISGLAVSTVIVEAGLSSGSLITAECAASQGRNIYAIPGNINSVNSIGTNKLIRDGAMPLVSFEDIVDDLGIERKVTRSAVEGLSSDEKLIYFTVLQNGEVSRDFISMKTGKQPSHVNAVVTILEMKGMVCSELGKIFVAK